MTTEPNDFDDNNAYITDHAYEGLDSGEWCNAMDLDKGMCCRTRAEHTS